MCKQSIGIQIRFVAVFALRHPVIVISDIMRDHVFALYKTEWAAVERTINIINCTSNDAWRFFHNGDAKLVGQYSHFCPIRLGGCKCMCVPLTWHSKLRRLGDE